jgi:S1 RNA binding domain
VRALLAQLQNDLLPTQVAHAEVRMHPEGDSWVAEPETDSSPRLRFKFVDASFDGASSTILRFDQMLDARFWRIGFTFKTRDLCDAFAQEVVRTATSRLASELLGLQRILERFTPKTLKQELRIVPYPRDRRFEHLILDILNEEDRHARVAPLVEDFREKTDLRVKYPGLKRRRGARVQVTSMVEPELHKTKLEAIKLAEEFVFLSPLSLAEFVDSLQDHAAANSISGTPTFALSSLWDCLEAKPIDVRELASELKRIMSDATTGPPDSPLGPMVRVPLPIRQLIRLFVETRATESTSRLRMREKANSKNLASSGNDFDDCERNEKRAEFLQALTAGDRILGRVRNVVDYGAFIDLGCVDGLLHLSGIPGGVKGMIGERLTEGDEIEVEVLKIDIEQQRVSLRIPMDTDGE